MKSYTLKNISQQKYLFFTGKGELARPALPVLQLSRWLIAGKTCC